MISLASSTILALSFTASVWASGPGVVHIPLVRGEVPPGLWQTLRKRAGTNYAAVNLQNLESVYSINISIAGQPTSVVLDTGSFELWVDPTCSTASRSADTDSGDEDSMASSPTYCEAIGRYSPTNSTTAEALGEGNTFVYADGTKIEVDYFLDNVEIGGLTVIQQKFGAASSSNATALGIMGLGPSPAYGYNTTSQTYSYVLNSLASQGQIGSRAFALDLRDYDNSTGSLVFGGLDNKKFSGSLQTLPLETVQTTIDGSTYTDYGYYVTVLAVGITSPNTTFSLNYSQSSFLAVLDSGTSLILTPRGLSAQICSDAGGTEATSFGVTFCYFEDCSARDKTGGLDVNFNGKTIQVTYENLVTELVENGVSFCYLAVSDTTVDTDPPTYILGAPFLRASYAVFDWDRQQVHLAQADDCGSNIMAITGGIPAAAGAGCKESSSVQSARWNVALMASMAFVAVGIVTRC